MRRGVRTVWIAMGLAGQSAGAAGRLAQADLAGGNGELFWPAVAIIGLAVVALVLGGLVGVGRRRFGEHQARTAAELALLKTRLEEQARAQALEQAQAQRASEARAAWVRTVAQETLAAAADLAEAAPLLSHADLPGHLRGQALRVHGLVQSRHRALARLADAFLLEAGSLALAPASFDLDALLQGFCEAAAAQARGGERALVVEVEPDVPQSLFGDAPRLMELLLSQLQDISRASGTERVIHIGLDQPRVSHAPPAPGETLLLRFERSGAGPAGADALPAAQPGLGGPVCARLIELMQGSSGCRDPQGKDPVSWFTAQLQVGDGPAAAGPAWSGRRALVVDAGERARAMLAKQLGHWGIAVMAVGSGYGAVQAAISAERAGAGFDLALLNADLPDLGGLETVRLLQTSGMHRPPALVLLLDGQAEVSGLLARAQEEGVGEVLAKPLSRLALRQALEPLFARAAPGAPAAPAVRREPGLPAALVALGGARVLLVEDNEINQQIALELLQASGMEVQLAAHGQAALDLLNWQYFDLVLMDLQMPTMDGLSATRAIRADRRHAALPVIAMTAAGSLLERQRCLDAGMNAHLVKPFDLDSLWAVLQRWIVPRPGLGQQAAQEPGDAATAGPRRLQLPDPIPGFDLRRALARMGDREDLFLRTARMFVDTQADAVDQVRAALAAGDRETAIRLATTLKNLAGNLGAETLQTEALGLESLLREGLVPMALMRAEHVEETLVVACFAIKPMLDAAASRLAAQRAANRPQPPP